MSELKPLTAAEAHALRRVADALDEAVSQLPASPLRDILARGRDAMRRLAG